jgi:ABC-type transport system involved in multi-copper enzyme maturation permease subunit
MMTIALASFKEALKKKIILLIGLMTLVYLVILALITWFGYENLRKSNAGNGALMSNAAVMVSLIGFYFSSMIAALLTIMASVGCISSEAENGVIYSIITKPVKRIQYVTGKYLGLALLSSAYSTFLYIGVVVINRAVGVPPLDKPDIPSLSAGLALFILEPLTILSISIWGSVSFKTINNGIFVIAVYILGILGGMMEQIGTATKMDGLAQWGIAISLISPFDSIYRKMVEVIYSTSNVPLFMSSPLFLSNTTPSNWMMLYACVFLAGLLFLAVHKFNTKDIS